MNKTNLLGSIIITGLLAGCGGESSSSNEKSSNLNRTVQIERGAVLNATVSDAKGNIGKAISKYSNIYKFDEDITYPVTVTSGIIDVNANSQIDNSDFELTTTLISSNSKITFLSTIIYNKDKNKENENLQKLYNLTKDEFSQYNFNENDLRKLPSSNFLSAVITNSLYKQFKENTYLGSEYLEKLTKDDSTIQEDIKAYISNFKTEYEADTSNSKETKAQNLEKLVINDLTTSNIITLLDDVNIQRINTEINSQSIYFDKSMIQGKTFYFLTESKDTYLAFLFEENRVVISFYNLENGIWNKEDFTSEIEYSVKNSEVIFNTTSDTQLTYLNQAFNNKFIYNDNLISNLPEELKGLENETQTPIEENSINILLNKTFYTSIDEEYKDYYCTVSFENTFYADEKCYIKETDDWVLHSDDVLEYGEIKTTEKELIYEDSDNKTTTTIQELTDSYYLVHFKNEDKNSTVIHSGTDKWYLNKPSWITQNLK